MIPHFFAIYSGCTVLFHSVAVSAPFAVPSNVMSRAIAVPTALGLYRFLVYQALGVFEIFGISSNEDTLQAKSSRIWISLLSFSGKSELSYFQGRAEVFSAHGW